MSSMYIKSVTLQSHILTRVVINHGSHKGAMQY